VDIGFVERFPSVVPLADLRTNPALRAMWVLKRGMRLSVQPVTAQEFEEVRRMGHARR
jgi:predicted RNA-binding protein with PUA-like domain